MNKYYSYELIDKWTVEQAETSRLSVEELVYLISSQPEQRNGIDDIESYNVDLDIIKESKDYHYKTGCLDDPKAIKYWAERSVYYESREMGALRWLVMVPQKNCEIKAEKIPLVVVFHKESYSDPFWAMKTLDIYKDYCHLVAKELDFGIIFIVSNNEPIDNSHFSGIINESIQLFAGQRERIFFDIKLLGDQQEFAAGQLFPEKKSENFKMFHVINMADEWFVPFVPALNDLGAEDGTLDKEWIIHSLMGKEIIEARYPMWEFDYELGQDVKNFWLQMGLDLRISYCKNERFVVFSPKDMDEKLPLVIILTEVFEGNDAGVLSGFSEYRYYGEVAGHGDCILLFFAMESPELNDLLVEILKDVVDELPVDKSRVYITGHSHNGHYAQEFMRRHPDLIAAGAPLGNSPGLPDPSVSHEAVVVTDDKALLMETMDMPTIIIAGCNEVGGMFPIAKDSKAFDPGIVVEGKGASASGKIEMFNRRLQAMNCQTINEASFYDSLTSENLAIKTLALPGDKGFTLYLNGFEHYVVDFKNKDDMYHFRVVGIQNASHMILPTMHKCAWDYMRRFARDWKTGSVIEIDHE